MHQPTKYYLISPLHRQQASTKPSLDRHEVCPIWLIVESCNFFHVMQTISNVITNMSTEKRSKEEWKEWKRKLESMEEKEDSLEDISVMPNSCTAIPHEAQDEQPSLEQFEEVAARDFDEAMMENDEIIKFVLKNKSTFNKFHFCRSRGGVYFS